MSSADSSSSRRWSDASLALIKAASVAFILAGLVYLGIAGVNYAVLGAVYFESEQAGTVVVIVYALVLFALASAVGVVGMWSTYNRVRLKALSITACVFVIAILAGVVTANFGVRDSAFDNGIVFGMNLFFGVLALATGGLGVSAIVSDGRPGPSDAFDGQGAPGTLVPTSAVPAADADATMVMDPADPHGTVEGRPDDRDEGDGDQDEPPRVGKRFAPRPPAPAHAAAPAPAPAPLDGSDPEGADAPEAEPDGSEGDGDPSAEAADGRGDAAPADDGDGLDLDEPSSGGEAEDDAPASDGAAPAGEDDGSASPDGGDDAEDVFVSGPVRRYRVDTSAPRRDGGGVPLPRIARTAVPRDAEPDPIDDVVEDLGPITSFDRGPAAPGHVATPEAPDAPGPVSPAAVDEVEWVDFCERSRLGDEGGEADSPGLFGIRRRKR